MRTGFVKRRRTIKAQIQRVLLEFSADDAGFVETLSNKLGWKVIAESEDDTRQDNAREVSAGEIYKTEDIDWSKYSPEIQQLRRLHTKITAEDIASDPRLAYILSK